MLFPTGARALVAAVVLATGLGLGVRPAASAAQPQVAGERPWLVLVDDLHLDFRNTGRIRAAVAAVLRPLHDMAGLAAIRSTGPSSLALEVAPGAAWGTLGDAVKRITGNGLKPSDIVQARDVRELVYRARQTRLAFDALVRDSGGTPPVVLLVSNGFRSDVPQVSEEIAELTAAANRAGAAIVPLDLQPFDAPAPDPRVSAVVMDQHRQAIAASLDLLARDTGGTLWRAGDDVASVQSRLR